MRTRVARVIKPAMVAVFVAMSVVFMPPHVVAQESVLERYSLAHGGDAGASGLTAVLFDENLGNGTATAQIVFTSAGDGSELSLRVRRHVRRGEITFALLVFGVEIRAYDTEGVLVYSRDLDGFTFGDSSSGRWFRRLKDLPANVAALTITFVGNYE
jgi:hypothetical protein